ncbi:MAG: AbrB/MazE/SpoVT family DNA-binding domain-containing protein [Dehalococcoidia bacterium]|nr:MAG: AbrB/MazE/SpoVT family DNA-binding domain-containing protein [Dehalococcoidia bacterium]
MSKEKFVHKLTKKNKYSYFVVIPKDIIDSYNWRDGQKIVVESYGKGKVLISDWKPKN